MNQQQLTQKPNIINTFDPTLNPKNAAKKDYEYIGDIIYNECMSRDTIKDIMELINQHGYKLGSPSESKETNIFCGLYMPMGKKTIT